MATYRGIEAACHAVVELLRDNYDPAAFNRDLEFRVLSTGGFNGGLTAGVSVFLYRVMLNDSHRTPPDAAMSTARRSNLSFRSTRTSSSPPGRPKHPSNRRFWDG
ncbi:hypothetical protein ACFQZK_00615 [Rhodococcus aetherivorans]